MSTVAGTSIGYTAEEAGYDSPCWRYVGATNASGYAVRGGRLVHRRVLEAVGRELAEHIHHECRNTWCINPGHLTAITQAEHSRISALDRLRDAGTGNNAVKAARLRLGLTQPQAAERLGVTRSTFQRWEDSDFQPDDLVIDTLTWRNVPVGNMARNKGARGELEVLNLIREAGWPAATRNFQSGGQGHGDIVHGPQSTHIEVKRTEKMRLWDWIEQAAAESAEGHVPTVVFRRSHSEWMACIPFEELLALLRLREQG